ncbi:hypothetical protein [Pseudomonas agarici]|uniref:hypothetical protein n=1 Tax=Pseudomonas agarici TaxID=46677 RepID=UPI0015A18946|nr:hypothetical protein [Pseudomonas agarici]NWB94219.1 hypothetical protein [Pseudomonas agarici]
MKYFKLNPNVSSKKWKGYLNPQAKIFDDTGAISLTSLFDSKSRITKDLFYKPLTNGAFPPVNTIGSQFITFDQDIENISCLDNSGVQLLPIRNTETQHSYLLMHIYTHIDCIEWNLSKIDPWPANYIPEEWESKRARFFIDPVIISEKIPLNLSAFRLSGWEDAFNIVITDKMRNKILSLDFDHSFLEFHELTVI